MSTKFQNLLPPPRCPHSSSTYSEASSGPSTPMSGISTVAIKDGHEGNRPSADGSSLAADRLARLGGAGSGYFDLLPAPGAGSTASNPGGGLTSVTPCSPYLSAIGNSTSVPCDKEGNSVQNRSSPASSTTTSSVAEARKEARLIGGMTYDDSVVDTTNRSPIPVLNRGEGEGSEVEGRRRLELQQRKGRVGGEKKSKA